MIPYKKVFILTGMSDIDWERQTKANVLECFIERVFHRGKLNNFEKEWKKLDDRSNCLYIIDECHIGAEKGQTLSDTLKRLGILDLKYLLESRSKILNVSATPAHTLYDVEKWQHNGKKMHMTTRLNISTSYRGFEYFTDHNMMNNFIDLNKESECKEIQNLILTRWTNQDARYHIIRMGPKDIKIQNHLTKICADNGWFWKPHTSKDRIEEIDEKMSKKPDRHTIIGIKGFWRAGKRMEKKWVGIVLEM
jgi:hypothetical protein